MTNQMIRIRIFSQLICLNRYVCVYVSMHVCSYVGMYMYACMYVWVDGWMDGCICTQTGRYVDMNI